MTRSVKEVVKDKGNQVPKFSVLVPAYKSEYLFETLRSIFAQSFQDYEVIVLDDYSPNPIAEICSQFVDPRLRYVRNAVNLGKDDPTLNWNHGLSLCTGTYVCLVGDDDLWDPDFLEVMDKLINDRPGFRLYRARLRMVDAKGEISGYGHGLPEFETWEHFVYQRQVNRRAHSTAEFVVNKNDLLSVGGYVSMPMAIGSDDLTYIKLAMIKGIASTNLTWASWRVHKGQISSAIKFDYKRIQAIEQTNTILGKIIEQNVTFFSPSIYSKIKPSMHIAPIAKIRGKILSLIGSILERKRS